MKKFEQNGLVKHSDIGRKITQRNASEHRRLAGCLKDLDTELHRKLVAMQAEIMEIKASSYSNGSQSRLRRPNIQTRAKSDAGLRVHTPLPRTIAGSKSYSNIHNKKLYEKLVLPEIDVDKTSLVGRPSLGKGNGCERNVTTGKREKVSQFLELPSSASSMLRPSSLPDLRGVGDGLTHSGARKSLTEHENNCLLPLNIQTSNLSKRKANSAEEFERIENKIDKISEVKVVVPSIEQSSKDELMANQSIVFANSTLTKALYEDDKAEMQKQQLESKGFRDYNDIFDERLKLCEKELPNQEEMKSVRYLRWRGSEKEVNLVDTVFEKRD